MAAITERSYREQDAQRWPEETKETLYIEGTLGMNFQELYEKIQAKWPGITMEEIQIEPEYFHTHCITYDVYDSGDWTNFFCITASKEYFERTGR
ncbi:MAG: hypothetical protein Q7S73_00230 [bacterium]|nr:hypothetical protein [bacterium]